MCNNTNVNGENGRRRAPVDFSKPDTVVESTWGEVFEAAAREVPDQRFLTSWSSSKGSVVESLAFGEFYKRAQAVAVRLGMAGAVVGDSIALLSHPTLELYICAAGILVLGGTCVNLNWRQPAPVLRGALIETTGARFLVASKAFSRLADAIHPESDEARPFVRLELAVGRGGDGVENNVLLLKTESLLSAGEEEAANNHERRRAVDPESAALVMFTSGSTGQPKGVPITHCGALWACRTKLDAHGGHENVKPNGTLSFLPNFHVIGFINNFLFNALCRVPCFVHDEAATGLLTADVFSAAARDLQPNAVDTVPAILESLGRDAIERGLDKGRDLLAPFANAKMVSCGGAPLSSAAYDALSELGLAVVPHYGQTELGGGFCLMGRPKAGRDLMRPVRGVRILVLADEERRLETVDDLKAALAKSDDGSPIIGAARGEVVVLGCGSATPGYLRKSPPVVPFSSCRSTGDVFERVVEANGDVWLRHVCRRDDVIVHDTGELTNPLPMEDAVVKELGHQVVKRVAIVGQNRPSPILFVEEAYTGARDAMDLSKALSVANAGAPAYSRISTSRVVVLEPESMPVSGKGNVVRSQLERLYKTRMDDLDAELVQISSNLNRSSSHPQAPMQVALTALPEAEVRDIVLSAAIELVGLADLPSDEPLLQAGLNSTGLVQLVRVLSEKLNISGLKPTLIFDHPTVDAIVDFVTKTRSDQTSFQISNLDNGAENNDLVLPTVAARVLRSPPNVRTVREFAERGAALFDAVSQVPLRKWDVEAVETTSAKLPAHASASVRYGAFLEAEIETRFDADFFRTKRVEVNSMDPQQRLLLDVGYEALHEAGYDRRSLTDSEVGTFTGVMNMDATALAPANHDLNAYVMMGSGYSALGARISYAFAMRGPCLVFDTACSSSLVATHVARRSLGKRECESALVAAPNLMLLAGFQHLGTAIMGMNSPRGRCHTFDDKADGFVRGEAAGAVVLVPASAARVASQILCGGTSARHNGRSASFTALNGFSQTMLIRAALADARTTGKDIHHLEAHGTGTALGDPIEVSGAVTALCGNDRKSPLRIAGVKANSGHAEGAAGITGLIAASVAIDPSINSPPPCAQLKRLNPQVRDAMAPAGQLTPTVESTPLVASPRKIVTKAGCSSFGWSGIIAHGICETLIFNGEESEGTIVDFSGPLDPSAPSLYRARVTVPRLGGCGPPRPLLHTMLPASSDFLVVCETRVVGKLYASLRDHIVGGVVLLPGVASIELALSAVLRSRDASPLSPISLALSDVSFARPCVLSKSPTTVLRVTIGRDGDFEVTSSATIVFGKVAEDAKSFHKFVGPRTMQAHPDDRIKLVTTTSSAKRDHNATAPEGRVFVPASVSSVSMRLTSAADRTGKLSWANDRAVLSSPSDKIADASLVSGNRVSLKYSSLRTRVITSLSKPRKAGAAEIAFTRARRRSAQNVPTTLLVTFDPECVASDRLSISKLPSLSESSAQYDAWAHVVQGVSGARTRAKLSHRNPTLVEMTSSNSVDASRLQNYILERDDAFELTRVADASSLSVPFGPGTLVVVCATDALTLAAAKVMTETVAAVVIECGDDHVANTAAFSSLSGRRNVYLCRGMLNHPRHAPPCVCADSVVILESQRQLHRTVGSAGYRCDGRLDFSPFCGGNSRAWMCATESRSRNGSPYLCAMVPTSMTSSAELIARHVVAGWSRYSFEAVLCAVTKPAISALQGPKPIALGDESLTSLKKNARRTHRTSTARSKQRDDASDDRRALLATVSSIAASLAGVDALEPDAPLMEKGIDSLAATELSQTLSKKFEIELPATLLFDYPTPSEISALVASKLAAISPTEKSDEIIYSHEVAAPMKIEASIGEPVLSLAGSVIFSALGCRLPETDSVEDLRQLTKLGLDVGSTVPLARWDASALNERLSPEVAKRASYGVFLRGVGELDDSFFRVKPLEASTLDPQQKLILEVGYSMLREAGKDRESLAGSLTGVFLGMMNADASEMVPEVQDLSPFDLTGNGYSAAAARLSYVFAMRGPCQTVDTACSSTLVAAHSARQALTSFEANDAVVLGPNLHLHQGVSLVGGAIAGMNSARGRCHTLDSRADGYLRAEGCGGVVLTLSLENEELTSMNSMSGMAVKHNGRAASFTALNGVAQSSLIEAALQDAGAAARDASFLEMHGTGTALGDPVEVGAASKLYAEGREGSGLPGLALAAVKANFGHTESSAGIAGVLKALILLVDDDIGRNVQLRVVNPQVKNVLAAGTMCSVEPAAKSSAHHALCGVSSFGFSGVIAHAAVERGPIASAVDIKVFTEDSRTSPSLYRNKRMFRYDNLPDSSLVSSIKARRASTAIAHDGALLGQRRCSWSVSTTITRKLELLMSDHCVRGVPLFAGVGLVELAFSSLIAKFRSQKSRGDDPVAARLDHVQFLRPVEIKLGLVISCAVESDGSVEISVVDSAGPTIAFRAGASGVSAKQGVVQPLARMIPKQSSPSVAIACLSAMPLGILRTVEVARSSPLLRQERVDENVYTLVPAGIDAVSLDIVAAEQLRPSKYAANFVQKLASKTEERADASLQAPGQSSPVYQIHSLVVKATGPPKNKARDTTATYEVRTRRSKTASRNGLVRRKRRYGTLSFDYRTIAHDRVAIVFLSRRRVAALSSDVSPTSVNFSRQFSPAETFIGVFDDSNLIIRASDIATLLACARMHLSASNGATASVTDHANVLNTKVYSASSLPDDDNDTILALDPRERQLKSVDVRNRKKPNSFHGVVVVLGPSVHAGQMAIAAAGESTVVACGSGTAAASGVMRHLERSTVICTSVPTDTAEMAALALLCLRVASSSNRILVIGDGLVDTSVFCALGLSTYAISIRAAALSNAPLASARALDGLVSKALYAGAMTASAERNIELFKSILSSSCASLLVSDIANVSPNKVHEPGKVVRRRSELPRTAIALTPRQSQETTRSAQTAKRDKKQLVETLGDIAKSLIGSVPASSSPLMASGFDSLTTNDFTKKISMEFDIDDLPSTLLFDHPTISSLADYLANALEPLDRAKNTGAPVDDPGPINLSAQARSSSSKRQVRPKRTRKIAQRTQPHKQPASKREKSELIKTLSDIAKSLVGKVPEATAPLMASGFDSLTTNDLTKKISMEFDVDNLPSTLLFDHPTIDALADYFCDTLAPPATSTQAPDAEGDAVGDDEEVTSDEHYGNDVVYEEELLEYLGDADVDAWSPDDHLMSQNLVGRVAILAGASRGIGRAIAIALAKRGCHCAIFGQSTVREVADACEAAGPAGTRAIGLKVDLRERSKVEDAISKVRAEFGNRIDILVQSASVHRGGDLLAIDERGFDFVTRTNVIGTSNVVHACEPYLKLSPYPQILLVAPGAVSAKSWLRFARGSTLYCSAKLMMGYYLELWRESMPGVSMSTLWPKYVVESAATDSKQGSNKHLQADNKKMVKPVFMGEAAALALTRPPHTSKLEGRVDYHLDADIHDAMEVGRSRDDFLIVRGRPWDELEVCFQVDIQGRNDLIEVFEVDPAPSEGVNGTNGTVLVIGAFSYRLADDEESVALLLFDDGGESRVSSRKTFVAYSPADCGDAIDQAIEYLGGSVDRVVIACDVEGIDGGDLNVAYDRLVKFPFFALKELKRRRGSIGMNQVVVTAAPPDAFPLARASVLLNEVLLDRSLIMLAIALEFEEEQEVPNPILRLCWADNGYATRELHTCKHRSLLPDARELNRATLAWAISAESESTPAASCVMLRPRRNGDDPSITLCLMSKKVETLAAYSDFPPGNMRDYWFSAVPPTSRRIEQEDRRSTPGVVASRFRLPGFCETDADGLRHFLATGGDAVSTVPLGRWATPVPGASHSAIYGSFLGERFAADYECVGMVAVEARWCDPQQLLVLESCCGSAHEAFKGLTNRHFDRHALAGKSIGVYLGAGGVTYGSGGLASVSSLRKDQKFNLYTGTSSTLSVVAGRVPYALGLIGPCLSIDTACCSSLVATHVAVAALAANECEAALSATVGLLTEPASTAFSIAGMFSETGRCHTFDASADGYARGEGCLSYVLDPKAGNSGATPPGFLGSCVQQDGVSASLTAPNGTAQRRLLGAITNEDSDSAVWESLEAHGTGTALGDPIEVGAASAILCARGRSARCTSFKANVGHLESAAAGAGYVALATTSLSTGSISLGMPPNAQLRRLNGHLIGFVRGSPFFAPVESILARAAPANRLETCRLSSFGYSGTIAHARFEASSANVALETEIRQRIAPELFRRRTLLPIALSAGRALVKLQGTPPDGLQSCWRNTCEITAMPMSESNTDVEEDEDDLIDTPISVDVASIVNEIMGYKVNVDKPLMDVGLDSFIVGELMNQLGAAARCELPATLLFDYPSVASLDKFLHSDEARLLSMDSSDEERLERRERRAKNRRRLQLSVVSGDSSSTARPIRRTQLFFGADARTPCGSTLAVDLCIIQSQGLCAVSEMPNSRFDEDLVARNAYPKAATYGGFVDVKDIESFPMEGFGLSRGETAAMDPQQRMILEVGEAALLCDGGYSRDEVVDANIGCYVGVQTSDFYDIARRPSSGVSATYLATGANHAVASGRLSYSLGLRGASMAINTACSTALVCTHQARGGLELSPDSTAALIVAVNLNLLAAMTVGVARAGMLSSNGRCHTLDERADGYVRSEGCLALLIRIDDDVSSNKLSSSILIASSAVRSDGKSASLTAPSGLAQQQLLREALSEASASSVAVDDDVVPRHVELHGTGTALGDPIEIGALSAVSSRRFAPTVGGVKANVGHSETCSGAFGLCVLGRIALASQQAPPQACLLQLNSRLSHFADRFVGPVGDLLPRFHVAGGVSSFGFSGAIAHVALDMSSLNSGIDRLDKGIDGRSQGTWFVSTKLARFRTRHRFRLVESRAPTPAVQKASADAILIEARLVQDEACGGTDSRPVHSYEMRWTTKDVDVADSEPPMTLIIGAGLDGVLCAAAFARNGVPYEIYEKGRTVAGVWVTMANKTSKVQTGKLTYTLDLSDPAPGVERESNYAPADEVCTRIAEFTLRFGIDRHIYTGREVLAVSHEDNPEQHVVTWRDVSTGVVSQSTFGAVIFAAGALRAPTLAPVLKGAATYRGFDSYGVAADMAPSEMANRDVVVCGHGAYGVENVRTGLEHGAKSITVVCRHRHSVLPRCAVYLLDAGRDFDAWKEIATMLDISKLSHAYTTDRRKRPAVSDQYYVAMRYGRAAIVHGAVSGFETSPEGRPVVVVDDTLRIPADVTLLCYGFAKETTRVNEIMGVKELTGIWINGRRTAAILKADLDVRREATPLSASNIPFATFLANTVAHFLKRPARDFEKILPRLPKADKTQDTTSFDFFASMFLGLIGSSDLKPQLDKVTRLVQHSSVRDVQPWKPFVQDCAADWRRYCAICKGDDKALPYADWLQRPLPEHKDGYAVAKREVVGTAASAPHWVTVVSSANDLATAKITGTVTWGRATAQLTPDTSIDSKERRIASTLVIVQPRTVEDLVVLIRYAANSDKVTSTVVLLSDCEETTQFLAQIRVARVEHPKLKLSTVTCNPSQTLPPGQLETILLGSSRNSVDAKLVKSSREMVPTLCSWTEHRIADAKCKKRHVSLGGRALVTGGTGALGIVAASLLIETGEASFVYLGTRQPRVKALNELLAPRLQKLMLSGRAAVVAGADTSDPNAMEAFTRLDAFGHGPVGVVVHAAGVLHDVMLSGLEKWMAQKVILPKTACLPALRAAVEASDKGRFVGFSSATVALGGPGQTAYANASGAIDSFAQMARGRGVFASAVQWLAVRGVGMHQEVVGSAPQWTPLRRVEEVLAHLTRGYYPSSFELRHPPASVSVIPQAFLKFLPSTVALDSADQPVETPDAKPIAKKKKVKRSRKGKAEDAALVVESALKSTLDSVVDDCDMAAVDDVPFMEMGIDSMGLTDFVNSLNQTLKIELPEVALFEHPTIRDLRAALLEMVEIPGSEEVEVEEIEDAEDEILTISPTTSTRSHEVPRLVIASMCGDLAIGELVDREFWTALKNGACGVGRLPLDRVHSSLLGSGASRISHQKLGSTDDDMLRHLDLPATARYGGFIETGRWVAFDNEAFGISATEAKVMDPQQRQLLEMGLGALEAAGIGRTAIRQGASATEPWTVGNFVALQTNDFARAIVRTPKLVASTYAVSGANPAIAAGRLGYALGLRGAAMCVDTACSTALVCLHEARLSFYDSPNEPALVSSVNAMIDASVTEIVERAGMLSPLGRCHTFDERADGYCRGEGVVAIVLRPHRLVELEGAAPLAVVTEASRGAEIASTSLRSDGRTASITAPSASAQRELLLRARNASRLTDEVVCAIECHGTGTALGDPIEIGALASHVDKHETTMNRELGVAINGVKANLGHLEPAAGFAGLAALAVFSEAHTVPNIQLRKLNPQLRSTLVSTHVRQLGAGTDSNPLAAHRRRVSQVEDEESFSAACVSSFGFSGVIAHARLSFGSPLCEEKQEVQGVDTFVMKDLLSASVSLFRARADYPWIELVEPLVYGLDAHADAAPDVVGQSQKGDAKKKKHPRSTWNEAEILTGVRAIVESLGGSLGDDEAEFAELGIDSIASTELTRALANKFNLGKLSPSFVFDNPSISTATAAVIEVLASEEEEDVDDEAMAANSLITAFGPHRRTHRGTIFLWSGGQGDAAVFARLGSRLGSELRVYGIDRAPGHDVGAMVNTMAGAIAARVPRGDAACYLGGLSVGGWLGVETAIHLERHYDTVPAAVFTIDGAPPAQLDLSCQYAPEDGARELIKGRGFALPEGWGAMSADEKVETFVDLLPSLGIDFISQDSKTAVVDLVEGASKFLQTLKNGAYDPATTKLPRTEIIAMRAAERNQVRMLKDSDRGPHPHMYSWITSGVPNVRVIDFPSTHVQLLLFNNLLDVIAATILANTDRRNRPG